MGTPHFEFNSGGEFGTDQDVVVKWGRNSGNPTFSPATFTSNGSTYHYNYRGDKISFTTNWNNQNESSIYAAPSSSQYITLTKPNVDNITKIPTVYCNWEVIWDYPCDCNIDCNGYGTCSDHGGGSYESWTATHLSGYYGYIRSEPSFNATVVQIRPISEQVTVSSKNGDWYYVTFDSVSSGSEADSGWCHRDGISGTDPNEGGGCVCDSDSWYCPSDDCSDFNCPSFDDSCEGYWSCSSFDPSSCTSWGW